MTDWHIRLARADDAPAMAAIEADAATALQQSALLAGLTIPPGRDADAYRQLIARGHCLSASTPDGLVGFAACMPQGRELHLVEMSVAHARQGHGIGAALLTAVAIDAGNGGFRAVTLTTFREIAWNAPFYARHGYTIIKDLAAHPRLAGELDTEVAAGLLRDSRCAMIRFLT